MHIISKTSDYYDSAMGYGVDLNRKYIRKHLVVDEKQFDESFPDKIKSILNHPRLYLDRAWGALSMHVLGVCGVLYPVIRLELYSDSSNGVQPNVEHFYTTEQIISYLKTRNDPDALEFFLKKRPKGWSLHGDFCDVFTDNFFSMKHESDDDFARFASPIILYSSKRTWSEPRIYSRELNCNLKELGFAKMSDAYNTFQMIDVYLGGVLCSNEDNMVKLTDVELRNKHGHDNMSFKKYPTKRKNKC